VASDLPVWLGGSAEAVSAATALWLGIRSVREKGAQTWPKLLTEVSKLSNDELRTVIESHPWVAEIVGLAWEEAARTSNEQKRRLLARVAAAALRYGPLRDKIEPLPFLIRTVANLEPPHIQVIVDIATAASIEGKAGKDEERDWSRRINLGSLVIPISAQLQREGLIEQSGSTWNITTYGWEFLAYLADDDSAACIPYVDFYSLSRDGPTGTLVLMNYGTAAVTVTSVKANFRDSFRDARGKFSIDDFAVFSLGPKEKRQLNFRLSKYFENKSIFTPDITIHLKWEVAGGGAMEAKRAVNISSLDEKGTWRKPYAFS
jgi:hypothetical protein